MNAVILEISLLIAIIIFGFVNIGMGTMFLMISLRHPWQTQPATQSLSFLFGVLALGAGLYLNFWSMAFLIAPVLQ